MPSPKRPYNPKAKLYYKTEDIYNFIEFSTTKTTNKTRNYTKLELKKQVQILKMKYNSILISKKELMEIIGKSCFNSFNKFIM